MRWRQWRRPGERRGAGAVGTAAMAKGQRRDPELLLAFAKLGWAARSTPEGWREREREREREKS